MGPSLVASWASRRLASAARRGVLPTPRVPSGSMTHSSHRRWDARWRAAGHGTTHAEIC
jgi:hypothetical protein